MYVITLGNKGKTIQGWNYSREGTILANKSECGFEKTNTNSYLYVLEAQKVN